MKLLRALAGNDAVKSNILKNDAPKLIDDIINLHNVSGRLNNESMFFGCILINLITKHIFHYNFAG